MKLRTGDNVKIIAGKDKGKTGKIIQTFPKLYRVVVGGVNITTRHLRPRKRGEKGQKVSFAAPIPASKAMVVCGGCGKSARIGHKSLEDGKKIRICIKCKAAL